jgi:hypothetical protein
MTGSECGDGMQRLTERRQKVTVMTVSTLRSHLESISRRGRRFTVHKVQGERAVIRCDYTAVGVRKHTDVVLPAYPTGYESDAPPRNVNVVLDPLEFVNAETCADHDVFAALLGEEVLAHYEKMHQQVGLSMSRCC